MQALEFNTFISDGVIKIPFDYSQFNNKEVKIIIFLPEEKGNYNKQELLSAIKEAQNLNVFSKMKNPIEWQKKARNEWE